MIAWLRKVVYTISLASVHFIAELLLAMHMYRGASIFCKSMINLIFVKNDSLLSLLASIYDRSGDFKNAEQLYKDLATQRPYDGSINLDLGFLYEKYGKYLHAINSFEVGLEKDRDIMTKEFREAIETRMRNLQLKE
jgi:tetratricopeptide (TPR) repeat protein